MPFLEVILAKLAPFDCLSCGTEGDLACQTCLLKLHPPIPKDHQTEYIKSVHSVAAYGGIAKELVWQLKFSGVQAAAKLMARLMSAHLNKEDDALIIPVPTATGRIRQRGYDQAKLLARELSKQSGLPYLNCLVRTNQAHQVGANRHRRLHQLEHAFRIGKSGAIKDSNIILVDDVITTGSTLQAAAKALQIAKPSRIDAITFAQAE